MAHHDEPLRISCDGCPGGAACEDCLVEFFLGERDAMVVRLQADPEGDRALGALEPALERALTVLVGAGLEPELLAVRRSAAIQRAS